MSRVPLPEVTCKFYGKKLYARILLSVVLFLFQLVVGDILISNAGHPLQDHFVQPFILSSFTSKSYARELNILIGRTTCSSVLRHKDLLGSSLIGRVENLDVFFRYGVKSR